MIWLCLKGWGVKPREWVLDPAVLLREPQPRPLGAAVLLHLTGGGSAPAALLPAPAGVPCIHPPPAPASHLPYAPSCDLTEGAAAAREEHLI